MTLLEARAPAVLPAPFEVDDRAGGEIRKGLIVLGAFGALFAGWAAFTPLDAAATAVGQVSVSGHNQIVQHRDGGVVAAVDVSDGQFVRAGQPLVELAAGELGAQARMLRAQAVSLQAQRARLAAEAAGATRIDWPQELLTASGDQRAAAQEAMRDQERQFESGLGLLRASQAMDRHRAQGLVEQIGGLQAQLQSAQNQQQLLDQQMKGVESLAEKGFASKNAVRSLQRSAADLAGARGQYAANINDLHQQIAASELDARRLTEERQQAAAASLREVEDQLNTLMPKLQSVEEQLARGVLRAQTDGVVTGLTVFRPGAVVGAGQQLMEIVPRNPRLVVQAKIAAGDIAGVHAGEKCEIRIPALSARKTPILGCTLTRVSADSLTDEKSGAAYYTAEAVVPKSQLAIVNRIPGADWALRPGVPVQLAIPLERRTAFDYLFEPLAGGLWQSFRQR